MNLSTCPALFILKEDTKANKFNDVYWSFFHHWIQELLVHVLKKKVFLMGKPQKHKLAGMVLRKKEGTIEIWYIILALSPVHVLMIEWTTDPASWEEKKNMHEVGMFFKSNW